MTLTPLIQVLAPAVRASKVPLFSVGVGERIETNNEIENGSRSGHIFINKLARVLSLVPFLALQFPYP